MAPSTVEWRAVVTLNSFIQWARQLPAQNCKGCCFLQTCVLFLHWALVMTRCRLYGSYCLSWWECKRDVSMFFHCRSCLPNIWPNGHQPMHHSPCLSPHMSVSTLHTEPSTNSRLGCNETLLPVWAGGQGLTESHSFPVFWETMADSLLYSDFPESLSDVGTNVSSLTDLPHLNLLHVITTGLFSLALWLWHSQCWSTTVYKTMVHGVSFCYLLLSVFLNPWVAYGSIYMPNREFILTVKLFNQPGHHWRASYLSQAGLFQDSVFAVSGIEVRYCDPEMIQFHLIYPSILDFSPVEFSFHLSPVSDFTFHLSFRLSAFL